MMMKTLCEDFAGSIPSHRVDTPDSGLPTAAESVWSPSVEPEPRATLTACSPRPPSPTNKPTRPKRRLLPPLFRCGTYLRLNYPLSLLLPSPIATLQRPSDAAEWSMWHVSYPGWPTMSSPIPSSSEPGISSSPVSTRTEHPHHTPDTATHARPMPPVPRKTLSLSRSLGSIGSFTKDLFSPSHLQLRRRDGAHGDPAAVRQHGMAVEVSVTVA